MIFIIHEVCMLQRPSGRASACSYSVVSTKAYGE